MVGVGVRDTERARLAPAEKPRMAVRLVGLVVVRSMGREVSARTASRRASRSCRPVGKGWAGALE